MAQLSKSDLILKIQELTFACVDLNLYLDNHPDDTCAINMYNSFSKQLNENADLLKELTESFDPNQFQNVLDFAQAANGGRPIE